MSIPIASQAVAFFTQADMIGSSNSSRRILAAKVPDPDSTLENVPRTQYARLRWELETALGMLPSAPLFGDD